MQNNIKDIVNNPHPINSRYSAYWDFLLQSYEGGIEYSNSTLSKSSNQGGLMNMFKVFINGVEQSTQAISGNLFMHTKEKVSDYQKRVAMSYYYNFCAPIIDIYGDHLFKQPVLEEFAEIEPDIQEVSKNIDRQGSSIQEFRKQISDLAQIYGHVFVVTDSPSISGSDVLTRKDQIDLGLFPYLSIYIPQNVINWALDEFGFPFWVLLRETYDGNKDPMSFDKNKTQTCLYRLWTRDEWYLYDDGYQLISQGYHGLGFVPITCVFDKRSKKARNFLGISSIADISFIARDIFNASSELRQILRDQTFAFLALQGTSDEYSSVDLGTGKGLLYPENRNAPQYVSPPSQNAEVYFSHIDRQISKIYQIAKLDSGGVSGQVSNPSSPGIADNKSGVSKAWDFNQTNSSLSSKSANLEDAEMRIWKQFAAWLGKDFTGNIQYPNEFSISSLMEDLDEAEKESRLNMGKTFNVEIRKAIIRKKFPRKSDEDIDVMVKEIESETDKAEQGRTMADRVKSLLNVTATGGQNRGFGNG